MKTFGLGVAVAVGTLFGTEVASAQDAFYMWDFHFATAKEVASGGGEHYAIDYNFNRAEGSILKRTASGWQQFAAGTTAQQIAVSSNGVPWILKSNDSIYKWNGSSFTRKGTSTNCFTALGVGALDTNAWALGCSGTSKRVYRYNGSSWVEPEPTARGIDIAVGSDNAAWLLTGTRDAYRWNGSKFEFISGDIYEVGGNGWVVADRDVGSNDDMVWRYSSGGWSGPWLFEDTVIGITADGAFALHHNKEVHARSKFEAFQAHTDVNFRVEIDVRGRYFDPSHLIEVMWLTPSGQPHWLANVPASAAGVVDTTRTAALGTDCGTLARAGLRRSSGPQTVHLTGRGGRYAAISDNSLRDTCLGALPP